MKLTPRQEQAYQHLKQALSRHQLTNVEDKALWIELEDDELEYPDEEEKEEFEDLAGNACMIISSSASSFAYDMYMGHWIDEQL